jgi:dolichol-phosphate mannosyltransferase
MGLDASATQSFESFCVIIPMYNEARNAETCVHAVSRQLETIPYRSKLIVIDDGSDDGTGSILARLEPLCPRLLLLRHPRNAGYGAALRTGMERAVRDGYCYALFMDSDLTNDPADISRFVERMERGFDLIKASRYVPRGGMKGVPWKRRAISAAGNCVARILFGMGLRDCTNGFRAVRSGILAKMELKEKGFPIIMEELYYCKFLVKSCCEFPVVLTDRSEDQRGTSFSYNPETFRKYLDYGLRAFCGIRPALRKDT